MSTATTDHDPSDELTTTEWSTHGNRCPTDGVTQSLTAVYQLSCDTTGKVTLTASGTVITDFTQADMPFRAVDPYITYTLWLWVAEYGYE